MGTRRVIAIVCLCLLGPMIAAATYPYFPPPGVTYILSGANGTIGVNAINLTGCPNHQIPVAGSGGALTCSSNFAYNTSSAPGFNVVNAAAFNVTNSQSAPAGVGDVFIEAGVDVNGLGGGYQESAGTSNAGNNAGGAFEMDAGGGFGSGAGGAFSIVAGSGDPGAGTGAGGDVDISAGNGGANGGVGGNISIQAGAPLGGSNQNGGSITLTPQPPTGSGTHGQVILQNQTGANELTVDVGAELGAPTGGLQGHGSLNAQALYVNGNAVSTLSGTRAKKTGDTNTTSTVLALDPTLQFTSQPAGTYSLSCQLTWNMVSSSSSGVKIEVSSGGSVSEGFWSASGGNSSGGSTTDAAAINASAGSALTAGEIVTQTLSATLVTSGSGTIGIQFALNGGTGSLTLEQGSTCTLM